METADKMIGKNKKEKDQAEQISKTFNPSSPRDMKKGMDELNIDRQAENEYEIDHPVQRQCQCLIRNDGNHGNIGIDEGTHETDDGKEDVCRSSGATQKGNQGEENQDKKAEDRRNHKGI